MVLSFVDRDMIMRYFGGGIGHLGNSPRHQVDSEPPDTEPEELEGEMEISDGNNAFGPGEVEDIIMDYYEVENSDDDDEQGSGSDLTELDSDEGLGEDSDDDSNDDGYGSF
jgi:hypothetical protein